MRRPALLFVLALPPLLAPSTAPAVPVRLTLEGSVTSLASWR
jgi:hypothetical protein